jgi:hypothetical protein
LALSNVNSWATIYSSIGAHRNPVCGCCEKWAGQLKDAGFNITMEDDPDLASRKKAAGVPDDLSDCHTAFMGDYIIEGHVPVADIKRLIAEKPVARGLAVPGMPAESPGMENGGEPESFTVILFKADGSKLAYAQY